MRMTNLRELRLLYKALFPQPQQPLFLLRLRVLPQSELFHCVILLSLLSKTLTIILDCEMAKKARDMLSRVGYWLSFFKTMA